MTPVIPRKKKTVCSQQEVEKECVGGSEGGRGASRREGERHKMTASCIEIWSRLALMMVQINGFSVFSFEPIFYEIKQNWKTNRFYPQKNKNCPNFSIKTFIKTTFY
jgi:hypothetical protein